MWNKDKSVILTQVIVKACYVLLAALAIVMLWIFLAFDIMNDIGKYILGPFYAVVPAGYCALICIDKLLNNVKKSIVFDKKNVKLLRIISWCCFYAAFIGALSVVIVYAATELTYLLCLCFSCCRRGVHGTYSSRY